MSTPTPHTAHRSGGPGRGPWSTVLFDLDGTIVDSAPGITLRLAEVLAEMGLPVQTPTELMRWVGPPLLDSFRDYAGLDEEGSWEGLRLYRARVGRGGPTEGSSVYTHLPEVLRAVRAAGIPLALATSKPESQARPILEHFGLTEEFTVICGASEDETRSAKADVIAEALVRLEREGADLSNCIMVGDRHHDIDGAAAHGIPTFMVTWGYGNPGEEVGALALIDDPAVLTSRLLAR